MIPLMISYAAAEGGWLTVTVYHSGLSGDTWITLSNIGRGLMVDIKYNRWRHTTARVYRGSALSAKLLGQREIAEFLTTTP